MDDTLTFKDLGVSAFLVTLYDGKVCSQASMTMNPMDLMYALMGFIRANDESAHKSMRLGGRPGAVPRPGRGERARVWGT